MRIDILTLFPNMVKGPLEESILKRAQKKGLVKINVLNIRSFTHNKHRTADDASYGGGAGMVLKPEPIFEALESVKKSDVRVVLMTPQGKRFDQAIAKGLSREKHLIFICGHYEGIDERVKRIVTDEISIGDYVLTGGELASLVVIDALVRLLPGVLGKEESIICDSFYSGLLDYPHYTRPRVFHGMEVPSVLLSGDHEKIRLWRRAESIKRTLKGRPDLLKQALLNPEDKAILDRLQGK